MKILILGGDGFCGWPTALHLSNSGHEVIIVDNFSRRKIDIDLGVESLSPIQTLPRRLSVWHQITGNHIAFHYLDVASQYQELLSLIENQEIEAIVHFAEQRSAPYSMKGSLGKRYTVSNNLNATNNVLCAITESNRDIHLVHLGTMGVYGYTNTGVQIPEGYIDVLMSTPAGEMVKQQILYPASPGSIYHMTKTQDALMFAFYNKNDGLRITDLHQGIVWGTNTNETELDPCLVNRFDYDGDYGTVLNRFLMQSAIGFPLTVYGSGGQTRAFIHIRDTVRCIRLAIENPPHKGEKVKIFNQVTETHRIRDLAKIVGKIAGADIDYLPNPRKEDDINELNVVHKSFIDLGLEPTTLDEGLLVEIADIAKKYAHRCDRTRILSSSYWTKSQMDLATVLNSEKIKSA